MSKKERKFRDRHNSSEFYDAAEFLSRYWFSEEIVMDLNRKTGPTVKHGRERNAAVGYHQCSAPGGSEIVCQWMFLEWCMGTNNSANKLFSM